MGLEGWGIHHGQGLDAACRQGPGSGLLGAEGGPSSSSSHFLFEPSTFPTFLFVFTYGG